MAFNEQEEAKVRELLAAFENGKRISDLEPAQGLPGGMRIEVMDADGETRSMELDQAVAEAGNPIAGRWWDNNLATPTAGGWFGSLEALRNLPQTLGLGRYLVTDDRRMRKLDPKDSRRFVDGSPAALDGSMGQCMWCWNRAWYFTEIVTAERTYWAITLKPLEGQRSYRIPIGGTSWLGAGVMDRTEQKLCSVISDDERYRGGAGAALQSYQLSSKGIHPALDTPQITMLGMPATNLSVTEFGNYARKRGDGWEANWFVAQAAVEILFAVIMGTRNSQDAFHEVKDADGLYQGGFDKGVTDMPDWIGYNSDYPLIPTSIGIEMGDGIGLVDYALPASVAAEDQGEPYKHFKVPCFFGLMHAGYGHLWRWVSGLTVSAAKDEKTEVFVAKNMIMPFNPDNVNDLLKVAECPMDWSYIKRVSTRGLCMIPTEINGSPSTYFADIFRGSRPSQKTYLVRGAGGGSEDNANAGVFAVLAITPSTYRAVNDTSPLCFFTEDPRIEVE